MTWTFSHYDLSLMSFLISFLIIINLTLDSTLHDNSIYHQIALIIYLQTVLIAMDIKVYKNFQGHQSLNFQGNSWKFLYTLMSIEDWILQFANIAVQV